MEDKNISLSKNIYWTFLIGFFLIILQHLNVIPPWFIPTDWGKAVCFRIILSIMIFLFICLIVFRKIDFKTVKNKIKSATPSSSLLFALLGIYFLATIFSLNIHMSLWDTPFRNGGFVNFAFYIFLAFLSFLIIKGKDWQKIWDFSIIVGLFVALVAIFQQFGVFSFVLLEVESRPMSTMANTILMAIYFLLLSLPALSFGFNAKNIYRKIFYFSSASIFFLIIIFISQTRGAIIGLALGLLWFLFAYPKRLKKFKIAALIVLIISTLTMYSFKIYLDSHLDAYQKMPKVISSAVDRTLSIFEGPKISEARLSAWKISFNALKEKPILGWGPDNFMAAFDKYYDPSLPIVGPNASEGETTEWFDKAHNFAFEIAVTAGIPALIIYLSFFSVLFWQLQKAKKRSPETAVITNGVQAALIGYLSALFFGFDSVSTYLSFAILVGYAFYLISIDTPQPEERKRPGKNYSFQIYKARWVITIILFVILFLFIKECNLKPMNLNTKLNLAATYAEIERCDKTLEYIYDIALVDNVMDSFINKKSTNALYTCSKSGSYEDSIKILEKVVEIAKKNAEKYPQYTENWLVYGDSINVLIETKKKATGNTFVSTPETEDLKQKASSAIEKALSLSPKRQSLLKESALGSLIVGDYQKAKDTSQKCLDLSSNYHSCYWILALANGYQGNLEEFNNYLKVLEAKGYDLENETYLQQLINMYIATNDYRGLAETYPRLIAITSDPLQKAQLYSSLAATYYELGEKGKAIESAQKILELIPLMPKDIQTQARKDVEGFIKTLQ